MASITKTTTSTGETRYVVKYRDPNGKSRERWKTRKVDAERFARNIETDIDRGDYLDPRGRKVTFAEVTETWLKTRTDKARSTRDRDASYLQSLILPTFGGRQVGSVRPSEVEEWIANLGRAPATRRKALQLLRSVLSLARKDGLISGNPAADVQSPKTNTDPVGQALTDDQLRLVIKTAEIIDPITAPMVLVVARCGLRIGEAIALQRSDVDFTTGLLTVSSSMSRREGLRPVKGKTEGDPGRTIPMPADVQERLRQHIGQQSVVNLSGFLFTAPMGGPIRYDNWRRRVWRKIVDQVGFEVRLHDLRHTATTRLFTVDRWNIPEVQAFFGHSDPRTTLKIYTHVNAKQLPQPSELTGVQ
jgi:integrase